MLKFQPDKNTIVWCDFQGFMVPEIIKKRPVIIIKKHKQNQKLVYVLPISLTVPEVVKPYHYKLPEDFSEKYFKKGDHYVKIDLIYTVSIERLALVKMKTGERVLPVLEDRCFDEVVNKYKMYYNI
jgi:uncharacterized protein YifN (PemK superfamily)